MRCSHFSLRSVVLITFLVGVTSARPGIRHIEHGLLYGRSSDATTFNGGFQSLTNPISLAAHTPSKRMMPGLTPIVNSIQPKTVKMYSYIKHRPIVPVVKAAPFCMEVFKDLYEQAGQAWKRLVPEKQYFEFHSGNFAVSFNCVGDTIPWQFVQEIADRLWTAAAMGLTELFEAIYIDERNPTNRFAVKVVMSIVDSSLSSSDDDFREGSVPSVTGPDTTYQEDSGLVP